jgi:UDP-3-O-[3-hydroxymyristoyl] glucosamine N-acyltransferase
MRQPPLRFHDIVQALTAIGVPHQVTLRRDPGVLRFCSLFAQEDHGVYFWEGTTDQAPRFDHTDIVVIANRPWPASGELAGLIEVAHPQAVYYMLMRHFFAELTRPATGIHPSAIVSPEARIGRNVYIGPYCVVEACEIGDDSHLDSHVVVKADSVIGQRVRIESHSTIGGTGVAWVWHEGQRIVQPQIGGARIGDDCFLGTDITIVRGSINEVTTLGRGCVLAHGTKIGHGCQIGDEVHFANNVSIAGNCRIGDRAFLSAASVLRPRIRLARGVTVGAGAVVTRDVEEESVVVSGVPARKMDGKDHHAGVPRAAGPDPVR